MQRRCEFQKENQTQNIDNKQEQQKQFFHLWFSRTMPPAYQWYAVPDTYFDDGLVLFSNASAQWMI